jgi:cell division protein FtsL
MALGAIPALCLLGYVLSWTVVMYAGYQVSSLGKDIQQLQIERAELQAQKRQLQDTGRILKLAETRLGMHPAERRQFVQIPSSALAKLP